MNLVEVFAIFSPTRTRWSEKAEVTDIMALKNDFSDHDDGWEDNSSSDTCSSSSFDSSDSQKLNKHSTIPSMAFAYQRRKNRINTNPNRSCLYAERGAGGIYSFPVNLPSEDEHDEPCKTTTISTTGCTTCVGVYIPIDAKRCFAAHIDGSVYRLLQKDRDITVWQIQDDIAASFRTSVRDLLDRTCQGMEKEVQNIPKTLKEKAVIVCCWPVVGQQKGPGFHITEVLCELFNLDKATVTSKYVAHHGFIVDHISHNVQLLGWTRPGPTKEVLDQIAKIADKCVKPIWGDNFRSVFRTTYEYVMPWTLGWETRRPEKESEKPWFFEYDGEMRMGSWYQGECW